MTPKRIVDVDDQNTWPSTAKAVVDRWISAGLDDNNLLMIEAESAFRRHFDNCYFRAYHFTRFLPHEVDLVRANGLRPLTASLVQERIDRASATRAIDEKEAQGLHSSHMFAIGKCENRADQVCLVLGKGCFREFDGIEDLLGTWGGEAIYRSSISAPLRTRLKALGRATVVTALIELTSPKHSIWSPLPILFAKLAKGRASFADVLYRGPIPPGQIESIDCEGDTAYRRMFA